MDRADRAWRRISAAVFGSQSAHRELVTSIDLSGWKNLDLARPLFWVAVIALTWPFLQVRLGSK